MAKSVAQPTEYEILEISRGEVTLHIVGEMPIILNRMAEKAKRDLLLGGRRKTEADKAANLKHDPEAEFRASVYRNSGDQAPTRLRFPAPGFKGAMSTAALDIPGAKKSEVGRLVWVVGTHVDLWGIPELKMDVVRSADINKTPDIRTRAILPHWACSVTIRYIEGKLNAKAVVNLVLASGLISGIGDFRQEKGKGNYGQFRICEPNDEEYREIKRTGGRVAQDEALLNYRCYDEETQELLDWYLTEIVRLGKRPANDANGGDDVEGAEDTPAPKKRRTTKKAA
jgi:hypothetical protein